MSIHADAVKALVMNRDFDEEVHSILCYEKRIPITGARKVAELLGLELCEEPWKCNGATATKISFFNEDVLFYELENFKDGGT